MIDVISIDIDTSIAVALFTVARRDLTHDWQERDQRDNKSG